MIEAPVLGKDQDLSLRHYLQEWLAHARGRVRATTYQGYESLIRCYALPALGELPLSELSPLHLQRLYSSLLVPERRLSAGTVLNLHLVLTQALGQAVRWGICASNPVKGASPRDPFAPSRWWSIRPWRSGSSPSFKARPLSFPGCSRSRPGCAGARSWGFAGPT